MKCEDGNFCPQCGGELIDGNVEFHEKTLKEFAIEKPSVFRFVILGLLVTVICVAIGIAVFIHSKNVIPKVSIESMWKNVSTAPDSDTQKQYDDYQEDDEGSGVDNEEDDGEEGDDGDSQFEDAAVEEKVSSYEYVVKDISWSDAKREAEAAGGHLVVITTEEEYNRICEIASASGLTYIWLGATISSTDEEWGDGSWITGEEWSFEKWYPNEPSKIDIDNTPEFYLCLWNAKYDGKEIGWTFNDQRNDIVAVLPKVSGKIGYIIEYEE